VAGTIATATTPFVFVNSSTLRVYVSNTAMPAGVYEVTVENTDTCGGSATLVNGYTVIAPQPVVSSLSSPDVTYGVTASSSVTISGSHFLSGAVISVGGLTGATVPGTTASATTPYVFVSSTTLRFWWPNTSIPPGSYSVDVTNPSAAGGLTGSLLDGFTVNSPEPTITSVSPSSETYGVSPSASVTIFGSNFLLGATITVGSLTGTTVAGTTASAATPRSRQQSQVKFYWSNTSLTPVSMTFKSRTLLRVEVVRDSARWIRGGAQPSITSVSRHP
jgi:nitrogen fixation protein